MASPPCLLCHETSTELEYYKFPVTRDMRAAWTAAIGAVVETICSNHFSEDDYCLLRGRRRLRASAVPSKLLEQKPPPTSTTSENESSKEKQEGIPKSKNDTDNKETTDTKNVNNKKNQNRKTKKSTNKEGRKVVKKNESNTKKEEICVKENGIVSTESTPNEEKDIEEMITNYQIKQTKTLADRLNPEPLQDLIPSIVAQDETNVPTDKPALPLYTEAVTQLASRLDSELASRLASQSASKLDETGGDLLVEIEPVTVEDDTEPVFIEVSVDNDPDQRASPQDCLMLLESVQCEVDPSSLMLPEHGPETDSDMEIIDTKKEDPISLLTSSDEDEVIIQEPHIDTVDVSDETDEDDRPLTRFVKPKPPPKKPVWFDGLAKTMPKLQYHWGVYQYCCEQCSFRTQNVIEFKQHMIEFEHPSIPLQVCSTCNYSTGSKAQFARHRRKHRDERNYKCHLCNYKARHRMSLMYHLKSHQPREERSPAFVCDKCGFSSNVKSEGLNHIKTCNDGGALRCDQCNYTTKRKSDFKRHRMRKHSIDDTDADFTV